VLIADEVQQRGTIDHTPVYPREVVKRALDLGAAALILVHNHPSGDPKPSRDDIEIPRRSARPPRRSASRSTDHLVIGRRAMRASGAWDSFSILQLLLTRLTGHLRWRSMPIARALSSGRPNCVTAYSRQGKCSRATFVTNAIFWTGFYLDRAGDR